MNIAKKQRKIEWKRLFFFFFHLFIFLVMPFVLFFIYLFLFIFTSWRLITLQYCSGFCHTLTWISHGFTCIPHPDPPPTSLSTRFLWVFPVHQAREFVSCIQPGLWKRLFLKNLLKKKKWRYQGNISCKDGHNKGQKRQGPNESRRY